MKIAELLTEAPKGPDWKILFKMQSKESDTSWDSGQFVVNDYATKAAAKLAAQSPAPRGRAIASAGFARKR